MMTKREAQRRRRRRRELAEPKQKAVFWLEAHVTALLLGASCCLPFAGTASVSVSAGHTPPALYDCAACTPGCVG